MALIPPINRRPSSELPHQTSSAVSWTHHLVLAVAVVIIIRVIEDVSYPGR